MSSTKIATDWTESELTPKQEVQAGLAVLASLRNDRRLVA